jgi:hypothetical protein
MLLEAKTMNPAGAARRGRLWMTAGTLLVWASPILPTAMADSANTAPLLRPRLALWGYANGAAVQQPRGVAFDPTDGAIVVGNTGAHRIEVFSKTGRPLSRFVHRVSGPSGEITSPVRLVSSL